MEKNYILNIPVPFSGEKKRFRNVSEETMKIK